MELTLIENVLITIIEMIISVGTAFVGTILALSLFEKWKKGGKK